MVAIRGIVASQLPHGAFKEKFERSVRAREKAVEASEQSVLLETSECASL